MCRANLWHRAADHGMRAGRFARCWLLLDERVGCRRDYGILLSNRRNVLLTFRQIRGEAPVVTVTIAVNAEETNELSGKVFSF